MSINDDNSLSSYVHLVEYFAGVLGPNCEVVLHDIKKVDESIIAIKNSHISGRKVGEPITDFGVQLLRDKVYEKENFILNYPSKTRDGKVLRSSTYFIKNGDGELIGMLCINVDITGFAEAKKLIEGYITGKNSDFINRNTIKINESPSNTAEHFNNSIEDIIKTIIDDSIARLGIPAERLSPDEKMNIVQELNEKGVFLLKGSVSELAKLLKVSENTIYRYLNKKD